MMKTKKKKKLSKSKGKFFNLKQKLLSSKFKDNFSLNRLRYDIDVQETLKFIKSLPSYYYNVIFQSPLPSSYENVAKIKNYNPSSNLLKELRWSIVSFIIYKEKINTFLKLKDEFECNFLIGEYNKSEKILDNIENRISYSLWGLEQRFLTLEYAYGLERNKQFLSEINNNHNIWIIIVILAEQFSNKAEIKMSVHKYKNYVDSFLSLYSGNDDLFNYFNFRLDVFNYKKYNNLSVIQFVENRSSIIDRYLTFKKLLLKVSIEDSIAISRMELSNLLSILNDVIEDPDIERITSFYNPNFEFKKDAFTEKYLEISDKYTRGNYLESLEDSQQALMKNPNSIELSLILLKSIIYQGKNIDLFVVDKSLVIYRYLKEFYNILIKSEESDSSFQYLLKISYSLSSFNWAFKIFLFLIKESEPNNSIEMRRLSMLLSKVHNVKQAMIYKSYSDGLCFLEKMIKNYGKKDTILLWKHILQYLLEQKKDDTIINMDPLRKLVYGAKLSHLNDDYNEAIAKYRNLIYQEKFISPGNYPHLYENIVSNLFKCLLLSGNIEEAIDLSVETYIINKCFIYKFHLMELVSKIESLQDDSIYNKISTSILFVVAALPINKIYVAYDFFLSNLGINKPSQLFAVKYENYDPIRLLFLNKVCSIDVMYKSIYFEGTLDIETERIKILQFLTLNDPNNEKLYTDEINIITKRKAIRKGIQQIGESKIFVDIENIRRVSEKSINESFNRYLEFSTFDIEDFKLMNKKSTGTIIVWASGSDDNKDIKDTDIVFSSNIKFILFSEMFYELRDRFISSNEYGLDSYLSVRIRHGTLSGQLRKPFQTEHLITQKDKNSNQYFKNDYWDNLFDFDEIMTIEAVHEILSKFSREIDSIILKIKEEYIQIKTETRNPNGLFDFSFNESDLLRLYRIWYAKIRYCDAFIHRVFGDLLERTETVLKSIRDFINSNIQQDMLRCLDQLNQDLSTVLDQSQLSIISKSIALCKTSIQNELLRISEWFQFSSNKRFEEFNLELATETSKKMINYICQDQFNPTIIIENDFKINGRYFSPFVDIFYILFDNVIKHSGLSICETNTHLKISIDDNILMISIDNSVKTDINLNEKKSEIDDIKHLIATKEGIEKTSKEGGTGIIKIQKMLLYDLGSNKYKIEPNMTDDYNFQIYIETKMEGIVI